MSAKSKAGTACYKTVEYEFDFIKNQKTYNGVFLNKNSLTPSPYFREEFWFKPNSLAYPMQYFFFGDRLLAFTDHSMIGEYKNNAMVNVSINSYETQPQVVKIKSGGEDEILIVGDSCAEILEKNSVTFNYTVGKFLTFMNGRLFYAQGRVLYFTEPFTDLEEVLENSPTQYFELDQEVGDIQGMFAIDNKLIIVCSHGLFLLSIQVDLSDFNLKRINSKGFDVIPNSVVPFGKNVCFLSDDSLCVFDGSKVNFYPVLTKELEIVASGEHEGFYIVNYMEVSTEKTMLIDISTRRVFHVAHQKGISKNGGYATSPRRKISKFSRTFNNNEKSSYESVVLDLGCLKDKRLLEIEAYSKGIATLNLSGDFGVKEYSLKGYQVIKCNEKSKTFSIKISLAQNAMPFEKFKLKYKIVGE